MNKRKGEKLGWTLGFYGGFLWVVVFSIIFFWQKKIIEGALGMAIVIVAITVISLFSPWRMPNTKYWKLYLFPYTVFIISIGWAIWAFGGVRKLDLNWWNLL